MKLIGSEEKGYKLVSSFEKPAKAPKTPKGGKPDEKEPDKGGKEE